MKWIVSTSKESVELTEIELLDVLFTKLLMIAKILKEKTLMFLLRHFLILCRREKRLHQLLLSSLYVWACPSDIFTECF